MPLGASTQQSQKISLVPNLHEHMDSAFTLSAYLKQHHSLPQLSYYFGYKPTLPICSTHSIPLIVPSDLSSCRVSFLINRLTSIYATVFCKKVTRVFFFFLVKMFSNQLSSLIVLLKQFLSLCTKRLKISISLPVGLT